jgi:hypothetical protein
MERDQANRLDLVVSLNNLCDEGEISPVADLADHLEGTAGVFSDKALAEIAYAFLSGAMAATGNRYDERTIRAAERRVMPLLTGINRVS